MAHLNRTTEQWQQIDTAHHMHPFTDYKELAKEDLSFFSMFDFSILIVEIISIIQSRQR